MSKKSSQECLKDTLRGYCGKYYVVHKAFRHLKRYDTGWWRDLRIDNPNSQPYKINKTKPFVISPFSQNTHNNMIIPIIIRSQTAFKTVNYYSRFLYFFLWFCLCVLFCSCLSLTAGWREPRCAWEPGDRKLRKTKFIRLPFCVLMAVYGLLLPAWS